MAICAMYIGNLDVGNGTYSIHVFFFRFVVSDEKLLTHMKEFVALNRFRSLETLNIRYTLPTYTNT